MEGFEVLKYIAIPIISALIGWFTNFLAVKMLFHPKKEIDLLLFKIHGLFPKRQHILAEKLGEVVSKELISPEEIISRIKNSDGLKGSLNLIEDHIEEMLKKKLTEKFPMLAMFLNENAINTVKKLMMDEIEVVLPKIIDQYSSGMRQNLDIKSIVKDKVKAFDSDKLEEILMSVLEKEFKFVEFLGGLVGLLIGLVQVGIIMYM